MISPVITSYSQNTVGTTLITSQASDGYTLFEFMGDTSIYLIDNCGRVVNSWESNYKAGTSVYLQEDGSIIRSGRTPNTSFSVGGQGGVLERFDWNGNLEWQYFYTDTLQSLHHDFAVMPNGNILAIAFELKTKEESIAGGRDSLMIKENKLWPEKIIELQPLGQGGALIKWEWHMWDHLVQDFDESKDNYGTVAAHPELFNLNYTKDSIADWAHANSIDYNADLDQIILSLNAFNEFVIIDHSTSSVEAASHLGGAQGKGGDILYRYGNPETYGHGDSSNRVNYKQHNVHWIPNELSDAGKIMMYNNGNGRPDGAYSSIDIVVPLLDINGDYAIESDTTFGPESAEWQYVAPVATDFYSPLISGAQRLASGNTLICQGREGRIFEISPINNEVVWEYRSPLTNGGTVVQGDSVTGNRNVFKAIKYLPTYAGFVGKDMSPGESLEINPNLEECLNAGSIDVLKGPIEIHPNPVKSILQITCSNCENYKYSIYNLQQQKVDFGDLKIKSVDVSKLIDGCYFVKIQSGRAAKTYKFIKE